MWIRKWHYDQLLERIGQLNARIEKLETKVMDYPVGDYSYVPYDLQPKISIRDIVSLLMDHIGVKIHQRPANAARFYLKEVDRTPK